MKRFLLSFAIAVFVSFTLSAQFNASSLVFYYPFNENTADASNNSFSMTKDLGDAPVYVDGKFGKAISLNGQRFVSDADSPLDMFNTNTFVAWIYVETLPATGSYTLIHQFDGVNTGRVHLEVVASTKVNGVTYTNVIDNFTGGLANERTVDPNPVGVNTWYHVAAVFDRENSVKKLFVNGVEVNSSVLTSTEHNNGKFTIGANKTSINPFIGYVDELALFNKALSPSEIQEIMNNGISIQTSLKETKSEHLIKAYPNPSNGVFQLYTTNENVKYNVVNLVGQELQSGTFSNTHTLDVSKLSKGTYLLNYQIDDKSGVEKLMIK